MQPSSAPIGYCIWIFEPYLTTKQLLQAKFDEIGVIRNRIAHFRGLHQQDLDRLLLILRELDQGFFRFCASYGDDCGFDGDECNDPVYQHFNDNHDWNERQPRVMLDLKYVLRPNTPYEEAWRSGKGRLYHYRIYTRSGDGQHFDYQEILRNTQARHVNVAHLILDSRQMFLHVFIPCVLAPDVVTSTVERFHHACANSRGRFLQDFVTLPPQDEGEDYYDYVRRTWAARNKPLEDLALDWPHYVIPPSHAYAVLDSSCTPCSMFRA
jgi:hypothetical protein